MSIIQMLFSAKGRIRRRDYWLWSVVVLIVANIVDLIAHQILTGRPVSQYWVDKAQMFTLVPTPFCIFVWGMTLVAQWPIVCLGAKRWHDRNRTGYIAVAVAIANFAVLISQGFHLVPIAPVSATDWVYFAGISVVSIWILIDQGCLEGTKGPNKYGPSPKQIPAPTDAF